MLRLISCKTEFKTSLWAWCTRLRCFKDEFFLRYSFDEATMSTSMPDFLHSLWTVKTSGVDTWHSDRVSRVWFKTPLKTHAVISLFKPWLQLLEPVVMDVDHQGGRSFWFEKNWLWTSKIFEIDSMASLEALTFFSLTLDSSEEEGNLVSGAPLDGASEQSWEFAGTFLDNLNIEWTRFKWGPRCPKIRLKCVLLLSEFWNLIQRQKINKVVFYKVQKSIFDNRFQNTIFFYQGPHTVLTNTNTSQVTILNHWNFELILLRAGFPNWQNLKRRVGVTLK